MEKISFVIPCYKSAQTITGVVEEIEGAMKSLPEYTFEIILVNDFPMDDTFSVIEKLARERTNLMGINMARNFGQHSALMAGFQYCTGDIVVCLDDDGQTPADEVGKLLGKIKEGYDVVYAKYEHKKHSLFRNFGSHVNELMARFLLGKPKSLWVSSYFAARGFVVKEMARYKNPYPYVIGLVLRTTNNVTNVMVNHRERTVGTSGYTFGKLLGLWLNGFTAFSIKPLRIATACGCFCACAGFIYGLYTIIKKMVNPAVPLGWSSMMAMLVFIGGMLMLMLGLIGEYIGRIYISLNDAPQFVVKETTDQRQDET